MIWKTGSQQRAKNYLLQIFLIITIVLTAVAGCSQSSSTNSGDTSEPDLATSTPTPKPQPTNTPTVLPEASIPVPSLVIQVPKLDGQPPVFDGNLEPGEWDQAGVERFADGSELLLMYADYTLYLAIRAAEPVLIVGNIYLQRGEEVSVMHSSAALGTAKFAWGDGVWTRVQDFAWRCRDTNFSEAAQAKRVDFLQHEGWLASNARMGEPNEMEYQISLSERIDALAVNILMVLEPNPFPAGLDDDCVQAFPGGIPEEMQFSIEKWAKLELVNH